VITRQDESFVPWLKARLRPYPQYAVVRSVYKALARNGSFLRHVAREGLSTRFLLPSAGRNAGAPQAVLTWPLPPIGDAANLVAWLRRSGISFHEGRNTVYLPPQPRLTGLLPHGDTYPSTAGFKILKRLGAPADNQYLVERSKLRVRSRLIGSPLDQLRTANYMHALGIGPRVWDVACWRSNASAYTAFVVDHVDGTPPTREQCLAFVERLTHLLARTHLRIALPDWPTSGDFTCPGCNKNLLVSESTGRPQYVDFQNFCLSRRAAWTDEIVSSSKGVLHFGDGRPLRGARYLYQSVPGVSTAGKRDTSARWQWVTRALQTAGLDLQGRVVLDVGCNSGMMLHGALAAGAKWGVGWDRAAIVHRAYELLLSLGASRFDLYGADLHTDYALEDDVPVRLRPALGESVILYLSVRQHVGLLQSLGRISWRAMIYEGHQGEDPARVPAVLAPLLRDGVRCMSTALVADGDSLPRPIALLLRT
jgi:hypothetical protein